MKTTVYSENAFMEIWNKYSLKAVSKAFAIDYLETIDYFNAPASIGYHGSYSGGLLDHSIETAKALKKLTNSLQLKWKRPESIWIIGLFHDICKADSYKFVEGEWTWNPNKIFPGHAEKSIIMLSKIMDLTEEEIICIRWHMGAFDVKDNWQYYSRAIGKYPNVLWTHTADMVASKIIGI